MINLVNISKYYNSNNTIAIGLDKVNLEFSKGEFVAVTGESGSGKSTLLNVITGLDSYEEGEMFIRGEATSAYDDEQWDSYRRDNIAFIYQNYNLIDSYTVLQNVEAVMLIQEVPENVRKQKAEEYINRVGLGPQMSNKASHLSSGQKQRLAIARALAKNTDIIVADEPTGNLDTENGRQVIELLHKLSEEKLVIIVTHNYEQVQEFVTRKIRLYNGEVASDEKVNHPLQQNTSQEMNSLEKQGTFAVARKFVRINRKAQPKRTILIASIMLFVSFAFFIFLGGLFSNADQATSKYYESTMFANGDKSRLIVRRTNGKAIEDSDIATIRQVSKVSGVEKYDGACDISYYYKLDEDYEMVYHKFVNRVQTKPDHVTVDLLKSDKYVRSAPDLEDKKVKKGTKPEAYNEVIVYSKDESIIGTEIDFYFSNILLWPKNESAMIKMKVVGIHDDKINEVYFSEELCKYIAVNNVAKSTTAYIAMGKMESLGISKAKIGSFKEDIKKYTVSNVDKLNWIRSLTLPLNGDTRDGMQDISVLKRYKAILVLNEELEGNNVKIAQSLIDSNVTYGKDQSDTKMIPTELQDIAYITFKGQEEYNDNVSTQDLSNEEANYNADFLLTIDTQGSGSSQQVIEVSRELFDKVFTDTNKVNQIAVFIDDYAYTDKVVKTLADKGYEAVSIYRTGATGYDSDKVMEMLVSLGISIAGFVSVFFLGILLLFSLMKLKRNDFIILKSLGMEHTMVKQINYFDIISGMLTTTIIAVVIAVILHYYEVSYVSNLVKYYRWWNYLVLFVVSAFMAFLIATFFNKHLKKNSGITNLKG